MNKNELTISEVRAMFFDDDALLVSPYRLLRYEHRGDRFYYYQDVAPVPLGPSPELHFATGVTTLTRRTLPQPEALVRWIANMGYEAAIAYRDLRAKYGSLMHTCIATMLIRQYFDLDRLPEIVHNYCTVNSITTAEAAWVDDLKQDLLAFAAFMHDYNVKVKAIELSLVSAILGLAGTLDVLCEMNFEEKGFFGEVYKSGEQKGQPKETKRTVRTLAIIDNKSGRDTTGGLHNAAQLAALRELLGANYPAYKDMPVRLYNWHPKDWRKAPAYTLVDQTGVFSLDALTALLVLYREQEPAPEEKTSLLMFGTVDLRFADRVNYVVTPVKNVIEQALERGTCTLAEYDLADVYFTPVADEDS